MPDNPLNGKAGNLTRCQQILDYFEQHSDRLDVDFVSSMEWTWNQGDADRFRERYPHIELTVIPLHMPKKNYLKYFFQDKVQRKLLKLVSKAHIDITTPYFRKQARSLFRDRNYDVALVSYSEWGKLESTIKAHRKIIDTHDFMTVQRKWSEDYDIDNRSIGQIFQEELDILSLYDEVWTYSSEEHYIFEQFLDKEVKLVPVSFSQHKLKIDRIIEYPLLYVASSNPHNRLAAKWLIEQVLPLLKNTTVYIVGQICDNIPETNNVVKLGMVEDINEIYRASKIALCPMFTGTGIKIKTVEALSYGIPVVTTRRGVDGLANKSENGCLVANTAESFAKYITELLQDEQKYLELSAKAELYFQQNHSLEKDKELMDSTFM